MKKKPKSLLDVATTELPAEPPKSKRSSYDQQRYEQYKAEMLANPLGNYPDSRSEHQ